MTLLLDEPAVVRRRVDLLELRGGDRLGYLHTLTTQHLEGAVVGSAHDWLRLDPKGNVQAMGRALVGPEAVVLVLPAGTGADVQAGLERFRFALDVPITPLEGWAMASVRGGQVVVEGAPETLMTLTGSSGGLIVRDRTGGVDLVGPQAWVHERVVALGLPHGSPPQEELRRVLAGEPAWGSEVVAGRRPQELGLLPTHVHMRKGCYPGQESVAKMFNLGSPRRALAVVELDGPAQVGDAAVAEGGGEGVLTSVAAAEGRTVGLALLPLAGGELPASVRVGEANATVRERVGGGLDQPGAAAQTEGGAEPPRRRRR